MSANEKSRYRYQHVSRSPHSAATPYMRASNRIFNELLSRLLEMMLWLIVGSGSKALACQHSSELLLQSVWQSVCIGRRAKSGAVEIYELGIEPSMSTTATA